MKVYLVGGGVRDQLMRRPVQDRDYVVVGATAQQMLDAGYLQVGADFPVFLHPDTNEEYALARTERKTAGGYHGFLVGTENVTLEEDLMRRDLTINAMAQTQDGQLIDLYGGQADLENKVLRHVGPAFSEDPVRVLRVLRFLARFGPLWSIAPETDGLMRSMVQAGELNHLTPERVWKELSRALMEDHPGEMLQGLAAFGLWRLPPFKAYSGALQALLPALEQAVEQGLGLESRFALAFANGNSGPSFGPEIPRQVQTCVQVYRMLDQSVDSLRFDQTDAVLQTLNRSGALRDDTMFRAALDALALKGPHLHAFAERMRAAQAIVLSVDTKKVTSSIPQGPAVGQAIAKARTQALAEQLSSS